MAVSVLEIMNALAIHLLQVLSGKALLPRRLQLTPGDSEPNHLAVFSLDLSKDFPHLFYNQYNAQSMFITATVHRLCKQT